MGKMTVSVTKWNFTVEEGIVWDPLFADFCPEDKINVTWKMSFPSEES